MISVPGAKNRSESITVAMRRSSRAMNSTPGPSWAIDASTQASNPSGAPDKRVRPGLSGMSIRSSSIRAIGYKSRGGP